MSITEPRIQATLLPTGGTYASKTFWTTAKQALRSAEAIEVQGEQHINR